MSKRNLYFGGFSLVIAGAAIAGGAAVSSSAMADGGEPADDLNTVHVVSVSADGEAIECTFDGVDLPSFVIGSGNGDGVIAVSGSATVTEGVLPDLPPVGTAHALSEDGATISVTMGADGTLTDADGNVIEPGTLVGPGSGATPIDVAELIPLTPEQIEELTANAQIVSADDARPGTPEECAAMQPTPAIPAHGEG